MALLYKTFPRISCYPRLSPWRFVVPERIGLQEIVAVLGSESRAERGDSAYSPNAQRRTSAQIQTQAGNEKTGLNLSRGLNRDSVVSGGGVLSERAEGRQLARNG